MRCTTCDTENPENAVFCLQCGNKLVEEYPETVIPEPQSELPTPVPEALPALPKGNGVIVLVFGILSLTTSCLPLGVVAWILGSNELQKMKAGLVTNHEEGLASVGKILGIIATVFLVIAILVFMFIMTFIIHFGTEYQDYWQM